MTEISAKYEQLIADLRRDFRPQREWGEGRGLFLVIGHFLVGVAAGAWLFGLIFDYTPGLIAGFYIGRRAAASRILPFLGRPERFWKMVYHVRTAWISRGFVGLTLFLIGAALYLPPLVLNGWPVGCRFRASGILAGGWRRAAWWCSSCTWDSSTRHQRAFRFGTRRCIPSFTWPMRCAAASPRCW